MQLSDTEIARTAAAAITFALLWTWESFAPFRPFAKGRKLHSTRNLILGGINVVMTDAAGARSARRLTRARRPETRISFAKKLNEYRHKAKEFRRSL